MGIAVACKAKFMLKGTAVTSIIILLILPNLLIFRLGFASSSSSVTVSTGLSPPSLVTLTSDPISGLRVGEQAIIITNFTNKEEIERTLVILTVVTDSEEVIESIGLVSGMASVGSSIKVGVSWTPLHSGNYHLKSFALSELENPIILANPSASNFTVSESPQTPQNPAMPKLKVTELKGDTGPPGIPSVLISLNITDIQGNPVGGAMVSATVTDSSGYWKTFSGQTNSTGAWNFLWQLRAGYSEGLNIRVNASKYGYEEGSAETNMPISP